MIAAPPDWSDGETIEADLCIVGAGVVGLSLAQTFLGKRSKVLVLEGGDWRPTVRGQDDLWTEAAGAPNHSFSFSRIRGYGGTGGHWAGICPRPEPLSFAGHGTRPPWPVSFQELEPWIAEAEALLDVPHPGADLAAWAARMGRAPELGPDLRSAILPIARKRDVGRAHLEAFRNALNVQIALNADVIRIDADAEGRKVESLAVALPGGRRIRIRARSHVLAAGGVENARLLLLSDGQVRGGLGNAHDQVGRAFMDHIYCYAGHLEPSSPEHAQGPHVVARFAGLATGNGAISAYSLSEAIRREEGLNGAAAFFMHRFAFQLHPDYDSPGGAAVTHFAELVRGERLPQRSTPGEAWALLRHAPTAARLLLRHAANSLHPQTRIALRMQIEASPLSDSRVTLGRTRDRLGRRRARVDWRIGAEDGKGAARLWEALSEGLDAQGIGRLVGVAPGKDGHWPASTTGGKHHMGTTRMSDDPARGVVDRNCQVHGMENLFVAGSSIFPTGGWENPTLTAVALALRLARRLGP